MRLIDADKLIDDYNKSNGTISDLMELILDAAEEAQPPNDPLTLEELLKTETPVWCRVDCLPKKGFWCLREKGEIIAPSMQKFYVEDLDLSLWRFYRRKPEEEII